jgi:hypothetical protein
MRRDALNRRVASALTLLLALATTAGCGRKAPSVVSGTGAHTATASDTPTPSDAASTRGGAYFTNPKLVAQVLQVAEDDAAILGTYDYRDVTATLTEALKVTTGGFRTSYRRNMPLLTASAASNKTIQTVTALKGAVVNIAAGEKQAVVLMVIKQTIARGVNDTSPRTDFVTISQTMQRVGTQWLVSGLDPHGSTGTPPGTAALQDAEQAAQRMVLNTITYTRARFTVEFARTLASATGQLRTILNSHRDEIRQAMVKGTVDLRGELAGAAVESAAGSAVVVLVVVREYKITGVGDRKLASAGSFEVTMERIGNTWLASKLQALAAG